MQFETPRLFSVWRFEVLHKRLSLRSPGTRFPGSVDQIDLRFRGTLRIDIDDEFYMDLIEEGEPESLQHRRSTSFRHDSDLRTFTFKLSDEIVGRVDASRLDVVKLALPPVNSRL